METDKLIEVLRQLSEQTHEPVIFMVSHPKAMSVISNGVPTMKEYPALANRFRDTLKVWMDEQVGPDTRKN